MADPLTLGLAGIGLARSLFRKRRPTYSPGTFRFNPDENDPGLLLRRRRALTENARDRSRTMDEIGRAGLLGSSAAFGILGEGEARGARTLEDINADVLDRQHADQLNIFKDYENFKMRRALLGDEANYGEESAGLQSLGGIGEYLGGYDSLGGEINPELRRKLLALLEGL